MTEFRNPIPENPYDEAARPSILTANAFYLLAGLGMMLLHAFAQPLYRFLMRVGVQGAAEQQLVLDAVLYLPFFLPSVAGFIARRGAGSMRLSGVGVRTTILCLATGVACMFFANIMTALWTLLLNAFGIPVSGRAFLMKTERDLILGIVAIAVLPGIFEELLFRGPIMSAYERGGSKRAIIVSGILFAMLHGSLEGFPAQFMMGLVLGYAVVATGSVYAGMMIHTAYNAAAVLVSYAFQAEVERALAQGGFDPFAGMKSAQLLTAYFIEGAIAFGVVMLLMRIFRRHQAKHGILSFPRAPLRLSVGEAIVLISGVVTALFLYANNIFGIIGYLV